MKIRYAIGAVGLAFVAIIGVLLANTLTTGPTVPEISQGATIEIDEQAAATRLGDAVRFRTVSVRLGQPIDGAAFLGLHDFLARSYPKVHATLKREIVGSYSLLYTWAGSDPALKPILLMGHLDVVPAEPKTAANWEHPPFSGDIADGYVWGRGTLDDKGSVLAALEAVEYLLGAGITPKRTVYLAFGHDEELDGPEGAAKIVELLAARNVQLDFTLDEGTVIAHDIVPGVAKPVALIGVAEKGYLAIRITARAEADSATGGCGHSSMPPPSTAVGKLGRALYHLETSQMPARIEPPVTQMFDFLAPEMPFAMRLVVANRWLFEPLLISQFEQGPATNATIRSTTAATISCPPRPSRTSSGTCARSSTTRMSPLSRSICPTIRRQSRAFPRGVSTSFTGRFYRSSPTSSWRRASSSPAPTASTMRGSPTTTTASFPPVYDPRISPAFTATTSASLSKTTERSSDSTFSFY
jgi:carboxypeptidase PM20D1